MTTPYSQRTMKNRLFRQKEYDRLGVERKVMRRWFFGRGRRPTEEEVRAELQARRPSLHPSEHELIVDYVMGLSPEDYLENLPES